MDLILKKEEVSYTKKDTNEKKTISRFYVEVPAGTTKIKVELKPSDYTSREILESMFLK